MVESESRRRLLFEPEERKPFPFKWVLTLTILALAAAALFFAWNRSNVVRTEEGRLWIEADGARSHLDSDLPAVVDPEVH
jgi:hypothetical protein